MGLQTLLSLIFDFFNNASILRETTRKESWGTLTVEGGNAKSWVGRATIPAIKINIKNSNLLEMEIVIDITSKYFPIRKGQIIFLISPL